MIKQVAGSTHVAAQSAVALNHSMKEVYAWGDGNELESSHTTVTEVTWFNNSLKVKLSDGHTFLATFADITDLVGEVPPF